MNEFSERFLKQILFSTNLSELCFATFGSGDFAHDQQEMKGRSWGKLARKNAFFL